MDIYQETLVLNPLCTLLHCHLFLHHHHLCYEEQNLVVHLWADLKGSIDGFIEGTGELLGEVPEAEEDDAAVELMSQEVIANVNALASGTGRP